MCGGQVGEWGFLFCISTLHSFTGSAVRLGTKKGYRTMNVEQAKSAC